MHILVRLDSPPVQTHKRRRRGGGRGEGERERNRKKRKKKKQKKMSWLDDRKVYGSASTKEQFVIYPLSFIFYEHNKRLIKLLEYLVSNRNNYNGIGFEFVFFRFWFKLKIGQKSYYKCTLFFTCVFFCQKIYEKYKYLIILEAKSIATYLFWVWVVYLHHSNLALEGGLIVSSSAKKKKKNHHAKLYELFSIHLIRFKTNLQKKQHKKL